MSFSVFFKGKEQPLVVYAESPRHASGRLRVFQSQDQVRAQVDTGTITHPEALMPFIGDLPVASGNKMVSISGPVAVHLTDILRDFAGTAGGLPGLTEESELTGFWISEASVRPGQGIMVWVNGTHYFHAVVFNCKEQARRFINSLADAWLDPERLVECMELIDSSGMSETSHDCAQDISGPVAELFSNAFLHTRPKTGAG